MSSGFAVPRRAIASVSAVDVNTIKGRLTLRTGGTSFPGVQAGRFRSDEGPEFWVVHSEARALQVTTVDFPWRRIVLAVDEPEQTAIRLADDLFGARPA